MFKLNDIIKLKLTDAYHMDGSLLNRNIYIADLLDQSFQIIQLTSEQQSASVSLAVYLPIRIKGIKNDHVYRISRDDFSDFEIDTIFLRKEKLNKINGYV